MALTGQQQAFVEAYLAAGMTNAAEAYRVAYPKSRAWAANLVSNESQKLLVHPVIAPLIAIARAQADERLKKSLDRFAVSKERISNELARLAFVDARRLFSWGPDGVTVLPSDNLDDDDALAVIEVSQTITKEGGTIKVRVADKQAALINLARLHGMVIERGVIKVVDPLEAEKRALMRAELIRRLDLKAVPEPLTIEGKAERKK